MNHRFLVVRPICFALTLLLAVGSKSGVAQSLAQPPEAFPASALESTRTIQSPGHLVLFSPVREIRGEIRSDIMARLPADGIGQLYELSRDANRSAARRHYQRALQERDAVTLYDCSGVECGRSNVWANQVFEQARLLGRDSDQDYLVAVSADDSGQRWLTSIYTVTRGNLREYVWVEHLAIGADVQIPGYGDQSDRVLGPILVPWEGSLTYRFDWTTTERRRLNDWAAVDNAEVVLAGFSELGTDTSFDEAIARAEAALGAMSELLQKTGVRGDQIRTVPVGPGVRMPGAPRPGNRIEILVIQP